MSDKPECVECALYTGTDEAPPPHDHPDNAARPEPAIDVERLAFRQSQAYNAGYQAGRRALAEEWAVGQKAAPE